MCNHHFINFIQNYFDLRQVKKTVLFSNILGTKQLISDGKQSLVASLKVWRKKWNEYMRKK